MVGLDARRPADLRAHVATEQRNRTRTEPRLRRRQRRPAEQAGTRARPPSRQIGSPTQSPAASVPASADLHSQRLHRDRASAVISFHWRRTSSSAGLAPPDAVELIVDLAAGRRRADDDDHDAEERGDHGEDRADHAVAGGVRVEQMRYVHRRADRVQREQRRPEDGEREEIRRAIRLALRTRPLQTRNTAASGAASRAALSSRRPRPARRG